jgi:uncharacterized membrane protein HdeD (DUF308 family)
MDSAENVLTGAVTMGYAIVAVFFFRFYWRTKDRLFAMFAAAFCLLGAVRIGTVIWHDPMEHQFLYWVRFVAYLSILLAILDKNLPRRANAKPTTAEPAAQ